MRWNYYKNQGKLEIVKVGGYIEDNEKSKKKGNK